MKVTFPHIGNSYIPFRAMITELGLEAVIPPPITQRTIELGAKIAPEFACLPFKVNLGNYIEGIEQGAEAILMAGGVGPCRFGYYGELQRQILEEAGYKVDFLVLEAPDAHPLDLWKKLTSFFPKHRVSDLSRALYKAWVKALAIDQFDRLVNQVRPLVTQPGSISRLQQRYYEQIDRADLVKDIKSLMRDGLAELQALPQQPREPLIRVILAGEIYMVLDATINFHLEERLGEMGVEVYRSIYLTDWVRDHLLKGILDPNCHRSLAATARPYLKNSVGGHGLETVAAAVAGGVNRYDGLIQLAPFTCMPEIVAMQVLPKVSHDLEIPYLTLIIDEQSAEAGILTRIEAFADLLTYQRTKGSGGKQVEVVSGY